jgi:hypothetical protein
MPIWLVVLWTGCLVMLLRAFLVVIGIYKDPILHSFEKYGVETVYSPLIMLVVWSVACFLVTLFFYLPPSNVLLVGILLLIPLAWLRRMYERALDRNSLLFRRLPGWYYDLAQRTNREERRRIAYLWLRLPVQTRMIYNARTEYFRQWVDLVLMSIAR